TVELLDATGTVIATTTTDPAGAYAFTGLPDAGYTVRIDASTLPASMVQTADPDPTLDGRTPATITGSVDVTGLDFGYRTPPPAPGTIASGVWLDENGDGVQDAGEPPIPGVRVELVDAAGIVIGSTTTAADGSLGFVNVPPGDYTLRVDETTLPAGVTSRTADADGTLDAETPVTVTAGSPSVVTDFGYEPDPTALGAIDGVIFHDVDGDSVRQPGEPVMSQVTVILRDAAGVEVARMLTLADGSYRFDDLPLGTYIVEVEPPVGFTITPQTTAPDGSVIDSSGRVVVVVASVDTVETAFGGLQLLSAQTTNTTTTTQPTTSTTIGTTTTTTSSGTIAYTGSSTGVIVGAGVALLAAGWFALIVARRREDETEQA
ncbi:MAG: SdrD B-like domain-containing protein, partial [Acidimicrobiales bacterium]